jgi:hypothetical protein
LRVSTTLLYSCVSGSSSRFLLNANAGPGISYFGYSFLATRLSNLSICLALCFIIFHANSCTPGTPTSPSAYFRSRDEPDP